MTEQLKYPNTKLQGKWITEKLDDDAITWAKSFGEYLANENEGKKPLSTSQIRKIFGVLKRIKAKGYNTETHFELTFLKPQLAYAVGRDKRKKDGKNKTLIGDFQKEIDKAIDLIEEGNENHFKRFVNLIEAIVAYHKAIGGE